ncbi:PH domain-containing protein [Virgibacillus proomii]|uniref:PH domain-containing protein n=1 Tax=Virgibacillus proomii TaxID=84407 RepID=UPI001C11D6EB|nr:PH domain-containing protein [Virgibacillus proomii]MBU5266641.1 PH domain-containing protein [Virgibacillus proomii]
MGLFDGLMGNASEMNAKKAEQEVSDLLSNAELKLWVSGSSEPIEKTFNKQLNIYKVQAVLANYICG